MSKAIQGAAEIGGALAVGALMFAEGVTGVGAAAIPFEIHAMESLLVAGVATEAGAIASAIGSNSGLGVTTRTAAALRRVIRGMQRVGGTIVYCSTTGSTNRQYNMVIVLASHPCEAIVNLYLDGRQVFWDTGSSYNQTVNGWNFGGNADGNSHTGPNGVQYNFGGLVFCAAFQGKQTSDPTVVDGAWVGPSTITDATESYPGFCSALNANDATWAQSGNGIPYLAGCTYVYLKIEADAVTFPQFPEIRFTVMGKNNIYDPRSGTSGYSSNWALNIADAITDPTWGLGDPSVNQDQLIAAANVCDEQIVCAAGEEAQFSLHWNYDAGTAPGEAIAHMMSAAQGRLSRIGGEWYIWPAYWQGPSFSFDENSLLDAIQWTSRRSLGDLVNRVSGTYIAPNYPYNVAGDLYDSNGYWNGQTQNNFPFAFQPTNFPMYACDVLHGYGEDVYLVADTPNSGTYNAGTAYPAGAVVTYNGGLWQANEAVPAGNAPGTSDDSGNPYWSATGNALPLELNLDTVLSESQAQRLAKIALLRNRQQGSGALTMSLAAFQMQPTDVMQFTMAAMGWTAKYLEIAGNPGQRFKLRVAAPPKATGDGGEEEQAAAPALFLEVPVNETDPSVYEWDPETEELTPYDVPAMGGGVNLWQVNAPTGLTVVSDLATALVQPDGTVIPQLRVSWPEPNDTYVTNGGFIEVQYCPHGTGAWQDAVVVSGQTTQVFIPVVSGQSYDVRICAERPNGAKSAWVETDATTAGFALSSSDLMVVAPAGTVTAVTSSATDSMIIVNPFTATFGGYTANCLPGGAVNLDGYTPLTFYYVYYIDPGFAGGAITPIVTSDSADFVGKPGYFLIGAVTPPAYNAGTGGSGTITYSPSTYANQGQTTVGDPGAAYDGNTSTAATVVAVMPSPGMSFNGAAQWAGFPAATLSYAATLTVIAAVGGPGTWLISSSLGGIAGGTGAAARQSYTITAPSGTDLSQLTVTASAQAASGGQTTVSIYEIYIQ